MTDFNLVDANGSVSVRSFGSKSVATRYANKHGLTVAVSLGSVALIDNATDADVDAVLASIDSATDETVHSLRDVALSFDQTAVDAMSAQIDACFIGRDAFEASQGLDLADRSSSYAKAQKNMRANMVAVARGLLALNVEPSNVIRRKVVSGAEFSAKALDKVTEICAFICGNTSRFQKVTQAFIACSIVVADHDDSAIGNRVNKLFLSNASFDKLVSDKELAQYVSDYQHKFMSGGKDTQSSQVRNVLDVLGLGEIVTVDHARGGIRINRSHGFYNLFRERYLTAA